MICWGGIGVFLLAHAAGGHLERVQIWGSATFGIILTVYAGAVALGTASRYTVFQRQAGYSPGGSSGLPIAPLPPLCATGAFYLPKIRARRRFVCMQSSLTVDRGSILIAANADASTYMYGAQVADRTGIWAILLASASIRSAEVGWQYFGRSRYPALRIKYFESKHRRKSVILAFDNEESRLQLIDHLRSVGGSI